MLSSTEMERMRVQIERTFTITAKKLVKTNTSDGRGGRSVVWTEDEEFLCRFSTKPMQFDQQVALGGVISDSEYSIIYPHDVSLKASERVRINSVDYDITTVFEDSNYDLHGRAALKRIK